MNIYKYIDINLNKSLLHGNGDYELLDEIRYQDMIRHAGYYQYEYTVPSDIKFTDENIINRFKFQEIDPLKDEWMRLFK